MVELKNLITGMRKKRMKFPAECAANSAYPHLPSL